MVLNRAGGEHLRSPGKRRQLIARWVSRTIYLNNDTDTAYDPLRISAGLLRETDESVRLMRAALQADDPF